MTQDQDYPEEYTRWYVTFFGRHFDVSPHVLIPRLETEVLIKRARKILQSWKEDTTDKTLTIDIGCGSGIIGTCLGDTSTEILFLDISKEALEVARKNFEANFPTKNPEFLVSDLLSEVLKNPPLDFHHILLLANLPYIKEGDWENMSADTHYEPKLALFGGEKTGFEMYERLFTEGAMLKKLVPEKEITMICEFGFDQREIAENILQGYSKWRYTFFADYAGIERFVEIHI